MFSFILIVLILTCTSAVKNIYNSKDCMSCLDSTYYTGICQSKFSEKIAYCCTENEMNNHRACYEAPMCSQKIQATDMYPLLCPHEERKCGGINSPEIKLSLNQSQRIEINTQSSFTKNDVCHFTFTTDEIIQEQEINPLEMKYLNIYFRYFEGVNIYISNSTSIEDIQYRSTVSYTNRNFTQPNTQNYYILVVPEDDAQQSDFKIDFELSYYQFDPGCPQFTKWNGASCLADYDSYCESMTPQYREQSGNQEVSVVFNGTACVVKRPYDPDLDKEDETEPQVPIDYDPRAKLDEQLRKKGSDQLALKIACLAVLIGAFTYIISDCINQKEAKLLQVIKKEDMIQTPQKVYYSKMEQILEADEIDEVEEKQQLVNAFKNTPGQTRKQNRTDAIQPMGSLPSIHDGQPQNHELHEILPDVDLIDQESSRAHSQYHSQEGDYVESGGGYLALQHHLHFDTISPYSKTTKNRLAYTASSATLLGLKGAKTKGKNIDYRTIPVSAASEQDLEENVQDYNTSRNILLQTAIQQRHGSIAFDEKNQNIGVDSSLEDGDQYNSARLSMPDNENLGNLDFHQPYKYIPRDGIQVDNVDDEWQDLTPALAKQTNSALTNILSQGNEKDQKTPEPKDSQEELIVKKPLTIAEIQEQIKQKAAVEIKRQMDENKKKMGVFLKKAMQKSTSKEKENEILDKIRSLKQDWKEDKE